MCLGGSSNNSAPAPQQPQTPQYEDAPDLFTTGADGQMVAVKRIKRAPQPSMLSDGGGRDGGGPGSLM